jgi:hypothetical protein
MAEFHLRLMDASDIFSDVTIQFLVCSLDIHFAGISQCLAPFKSYSKMSCFCSSKEIFSIFWALSTHKFSFAHLDSSLKGTSLSGEMR